MTSILEPGQKSHEIVQQICENLEGWLKNFNKIEILGGGAGGGGSRLRIFFRWVNQIQPTFG
jgi:hypothetical protein